MADKLPPSVLIALGLSVACAGDCGGGLLGPCLEPMPPEEPDVGPCLSERPNPPPEPPLEPCLSVQPDPQPPEPDLGPCLSPPAPPDPPPPSGEDAGLRRAPGEERLAREDVRKRVLARGVLPADVAERLKG